MSLMEKLNSSEDFLSFIQENIDKNDVQIGVYSIAVASLAIALRRTRPFSRFTRPSDIPKRFIKTRTKLNGTVERIEPNGALLMVQHRPVFRILRTKVDSLPVKISGVSVNGNGISWLQSIVTGNKVTFVPVLKDKNCLECEITMEQKTKNHKTKTINIGPSLVSIGFGKVEPIQKTLTNNVFHLAYYKALKNAELVAEKKRLGNWYYFKITQELSLQIARLLISRTLNIFTQKTKSIRTSKIAEKPAEKPAETKTITKKIDTSKVVPA